MYNAQDHRHWLCVVLMLQHFSNILISTSSESEEVKRRERIEAKVAPNRTKWWKRFGGAIFHDVNSVRLKASCVYVRTH